MAQASSLHYKQSSFSERYSTMQNLLDQYDYYFIDLWGVLWDGERVFPGAAKFVHSLIDAGKKILFLSNCAEYTVERLVSQLREAGLHDIREEWMATSGQAMELWFRQNGLAGKDVYLFGGSEIGENTLRAGANPIELPKVGTEITNDQRSDTVVVGGCLNFDWARLSEVVTAIKMGGLRVVLPNPDRIVLRHNGAVRMPPGMVVHIMETAIPGLQVERIGKPFRFIYEYGFDRFGGDIDRARTLMIGDSIETDVRGACGAGIDTLLLGQGVHQNQPVESLRQQAVAQGLEFRHFMQCLSCDEEILTIEPSIQ